MKVIQEYYPASDMRVVGLITTTSYDLSKIRSFFNCHIRRSPRSANSLVTLREFWALHLYKIYASRFSHPDYIWKAQSAYTPFEIARALISVGERMRHYDIHFELNVHDNTVNTAKTGNESEIDASTLWRGEIGNKTNIEHFLKCKVYTTGDSFVSFSKGERHAMRDMALPKDDYQVRVVYKYTNPGPVYHLDFSRLESYVGYEEDVVFYPDMNFQIVGNEDVSVGNGVIYYKLIHIANGSCGSLKDWKKNNYRVLESYYDRAEETSNFDSAALRPRDPSQSAFEKVLQRVVPCIK